MQEKTKNLVDRLFNFYDYFEKVVTIILTVFIVFIIIFSLIRISENFYSIFLIDFFDPNEITYVDYQKFFGRIMTMLISLEFLNSMLKVLKTHEIRTLVLDVILITALAIARKLIVYDYDAHEASTTISLACLLVAIALFYFLVKIERIKNWTKKDKPQRQGTSSHD